jgi:hypothetical protein
MFNNIVSNTINGKITFYTFIKIGFLIVFSIFQILMLVSIFGNVKVVSKISVENTGTSSTENSGFL